MQLNGAQGRIYQTITFAVLIFMIKTIRHLWVACARALRLTTVVKWATIQGFTWMPVSSVCDAAQSLMEVSFLKPLLWHSIKVTRHIALSLSYFSFSYFLSLSFKKSYLWCQSLSFTHQSLHTNWTARYSPCCLAIRQSILQVANYRKERERRRPICPSLSALISESTAVTPVYRPNNNLNWVSISCINQIYSALCILYHV